MGKLFINNNIQILFIFIKKKESSVPETRNDKGDVVKNRMDE